MSTSSPKSVLKGECSNAEFIQLLSKRPAIYDFRCIEYKDKKFVEKQWNELGAEVFTSWNEFKEHEKISSVMRMKSRYKNFRTCYVRELKKLQATADHLEKDFPGRHRYIYFDLLDFLRPTVSDLARLKDSSKSSVQDKRSSKKDNSIQLFDKNGSKSQVPENDGPFEVEVCSGDDDSEEDSNAYIEVIQAKASQQSSVTTKKRKMSSNETIEVEQTQQQPPVTKKKKNLSPTYEESAANPSKQEEVSEKHPEDIDEDKSFLLSLVPMLRKMSDSQKIRAKMEFLSIIAKTLDNKSDCNKCKKSR